MTQRGVAAELCVCVWGTSLVSERLDSSVRVALKADIGWWIDFYNERRPHSSLNDRTPDEAYTDDGADRSPGLPRLLSAPEPRFHLKCDGKLSEGWGPPLGADNG